MIFLELEAWAEFLMESPPGFWFGRSREGAHKGTSKGNTAPGTYRGVFVGQFSLQLLLEHTLLSFCQTFSEEIFNYYCCCCYHRIIHSRTKLVDTHVYHVDCFLVSKNDGAHDI